MKEKYPNGLRVAMKRAGLGHTELAEKIRTSKQNVQRWADGERKLPIPRAAQIAPYVDSTAAELILADMSGIQRVPVLDEVSAGRLSAPNSQILIEDVPLLAFTDLGRGAFFALRVKGNSMDRVSPDGSVIIVDRADTQLVAGKPYVFSEKGGEATYKLWRPGEPAYLEPNSWDNTNKPVFIKRMKDLTVLGRVRRTILDL